MMGHNVFEPVYDSRGNYGLQTKQAKVGLRNGSKPEHRMMLMSWRSPHATAEDNEWLEKKLRRVYTKYYLKVLVKSMGFFW